MRFNEQIIYKPHQFNHFNDFHHDSSFNWTTFGTLSAVVVALLIASFQDWIKSQWNKAELETSILLAPPDCHKIEQIMGGRYSQNCIYLRVKITNKGRKSAKNAEVMISRLWRIDESGNEKIVKTFLPMNLAWSHYGGININIPVKVFRHCDIGFIRDEYKTELKSETKMNFDTIVKPNRVEGDKYPNQIDPGKYIFELITSADNSKSQNSLWKLEFDGIWTEDENEMLEKHINIKKIS